MYRPEAGWLPASSYVEPVTPPVSEPDALPGVSVCFSAEWLPYILGSLQQMAQPTAWDASSPTVLQTTLDRVQALIGLFGNGEACSMLRWSTSDCALEISTDGGATWSAISGWDINGLASCLQQPLIDIGGTPGTGFDGPGNPLGISAAQMACNIANWLAVEVLQGSMSSIATSLAASATLLETADSIFKLIASFTGVGGLFFTVAGILIPAATAIGESALNSAATDATLREDLTCAIYTAISAAGKVTSGNVDAILTNINAISYGTPGIVGLLHDYVSNLGYNGLNAIQSEGALYGGSCPCGPTPIPGGTGCAIFNGTDDYMTTGFPFYPVPTAGQVTYTAWIYVTKPSGSGIVAAQFDLTKNQGDSYFAHVVSSNAPALVRAQGGGNTTETNFSTTVGGNGAWCHVAWVSPVFGGASVYINGVAAGVSRSYPDTEGDGLDDNGYIGVGASLSNWGTYGYEGKLADLRIYDTALTGAQIAAIHAGGVTGYVPEGTPLAWYAFNEGSGSTAHDYGSNAHDATWHGTGAHWGTV